MFSMPNDSDNPLVANCVLDLHVLPGFIHTVNVIQLYVCTCLNGLETPHIFSFADVLKSNEALSTSYDKSLNHGAVSLTHCGPVQESAFALHFSFIL